MKLHSSPHLTLFLAMSVCLVGLRASSFAAPPALRAIHHLRIELHTDQASLTAHDRIRLDTDAVEELRIALARQAQRVRLRVNGAEPSFKRTSYGLLFRMPERPQDIRKSRDTNEGQTILRIEYRCRFAEVPPDMPLNYDNPSFGVEGAITPKGAFLLAGSGWYPRILGAKEQFELEVTAPKGMYAVTSGQEVSMIHNDHASVSRWKINHTSEGLVLVAGNFTPCQSWQGNTRIYTFFTKKNQALEQQYLNATRAHLRFYEELLGPYPFTKFAVVENFFPSGYGFPSFTLLGDRVLRLPFIPETSLRHEIAHSWWGNGVLVDYKTGNWCEGLTSYVADYLAQELKSPEHAEEYRRKTLNAYSALASKAGNLTLRSFTTRTSPASQAVGYGKAMFVFHMLRTRVGDGPFWETLRDLYAKRLFKTTSWSDFQAAFAGKPNFDHATAQRFFRQWVDRTGAPILRLKDVTLNEAEEAGWIIQGVLVQETPPYQLMLPVRVETEAGPSLEFLQLPARAETPFTIERDYKPFEMTVDPEMNVFRQLWPEELPASVNSIIGAPKLYIIRCQNMTAADNAIVDVLKAGLGHPQAQIFAENKLATVQFSPKSALCFIGLPQTDRGKTLLPPQHTHRAAGSATFIAREAPSIQRADTLFLVEKRNEFSAPTAFLLPAANAQSADILACVRKLTHYGSYSYLLFKSGRNVEKGIWEPDENPLVCRFNKGT